MLLPGGPENLTLRRVPWVSFAIMGFSLLVYLVLMVIPAPSLEPLRAATSYRTSHPYLKADPRLEEMVAIVPVTWIKSPQPPPVEEEKELAQQRKLDELSRKGIAAFDGQFVFSFGFIPGRFSIFGLVAHLFFHFGLLQLIANYFFFYLTGPYLEDRWGRPFFAIFFLVGGIAAALAFALFYPTLLFPIVGSGGAVAAVIGGYLVRYHRSRLHFVDVLGIFGRSDYFISPLVFFPIWFIAQLFFFVFLPAKLMGQSPASPYWVNIFGLLIGVATGLAIKIFNLEPLLYQSDFEKLPQEDQWRIRIDRSSQEGRPEATMAIYGEAWRQFPENEDFLIGYWQQAVRLGRGAEAMSAGKELVAREILNANYQQAWFYWDELTLSYPHERLPPDLMVRLVHGLLSLELGQDAEAVMNHALDNLPPDLQFDVLMLLVETAGFISPRVGWHALETALAGDHLQAEERASFQQMQQELLALYPDAAEGEVTKPLEITSDPFTMTATDDEVFAPTRIDKLRLYPGKPVQVTDQGLEVLLDDGNRRLLPYDRIFAITAAAVREIGSNPYLVIDLITDDPMLTCPQHGCLRMNSQQFDPARLLSSNEKPARAVRSLLILLTRRARAMVLPDASLLDRERFLTYASTEAFELATYGVTSR